MGQLPNKYHISDDGKIYKINDDGSFTLVGNIDDIETNNLVDRPNNYLWLGIVSTLLCLPLGFVSIYFSSKVNSNWNNGNYKEAKINSLKAQSWGIVAVICSIVLLLLCWLG